MKESSTQIVFGVVFLAAGSSQRMGQPKLLLPWSRTTVLGQGLQTWQNLNAAQIVVVAAPGGSAIQGVIERSGFPETSWMLNPTPERGMFSSIQCAANWTGWKSELTHIVITLGDQPHLQETTLGDLIKFAEVNPERICQPIRKGRRRHPVLLPKRTLDDLKQTAALDLKEFLERRADELAGFEADDPGLDLDMDTPEDYEQLMQIYFGNS